VADRLLKFQLNQGWNRMHRHSIAFVYLMGFGIALAPKITLGADCYVEIKLKDPAQTFSVMKALKVCV
jgi:hypothetical protein